MKCKQTPWEFELGNTSLLLTITLEETIMIIILKSHWQHRISWLSPTICHYDTSTLARFFWLHPVYMQRDALKFLLVGQFLCFQKRTLLMSSSLLFKQCFTCSSYEMVCDLRGKWLYHWCFVEYCFQHLFKTVHGILVQLLSDFFPSSLFMWCNHVVILI